VKLREIIGMITPSERKVACFVLEHPRQLENLEQERFAAQHMESWQSRTSISQFQYPDYKIGYPNKQKSISSRSLWSRNTNTPLRFGEEYSD